MADDDSGFTSPQQFAFDQSLAIAAALAFCGAVFACACYRALGHKRKFGSVGRLWNRPNGGRVRHAELTTLRGSLSRAVERQVHSYKVRLGTYRRRPIRVMLRCFGWTVGTQVTAALPATLLAPHQRLPLSKAITWSIATGCDCPAATDPEHGWMAGNW